MSGIAALWHRDTRPVDREALRALGTRVRVRGQDGDTSWTRGALGLWHSALVTTPEAVRAEQPVVHGEVALVLDGRIDNRADVATDLGITGDALASLDDASLLLRAYVGWGEAAFARIVGDFAAIVWDGARHTLVCARDVLGIRPLFYRVSPATVWCASAAAAVAHVSGAALDEGMAAEWLAGGVVSVEPTLFADVRRVPPGCLLVVDGSAHELRRYWEPHGRTEIRYRRDADYVEHLRALLGTAVDAHARTPPGRPLGLMLSGGIDSATLAATAATRGHRLRAFTMGVDDPSLDETARAGVTARATGAVDWMSVSGRGDAFDYAAEALASGEPPTPPNGASSVPMRRRAVASGVRVLWTGIGSDEWFGTSANHLADLFVRGHWRALGRRWHENLTTATWWDLRPLLVATFWPLVADVLRPPIRRLARGAAAPPWIDPVWGRRVALADRLAARVRRPRARNFGVEGRIAEVWSPATLGAREAQDQLAAACGLEDRQPFCDRRIAEFALALPEETRWVDDARSKPLLRRLMRGSLPAEILEADTRGDYSIFVVQALERVGSRALVEDLRLARRGWVVPREVRRLHDRLDQAFSAGDPRYRGLCDRLWAIVSVELWIRAIECPQAEPVAAQAHTV
jgi:asparagine synthase (glutamine-hydrolysing)